MGICVNTVIRNRLKVTQSLKSDTHFFENIYMKVSISQFYANYYSSLSRKAFYLFFILLEKILIQKIKNYPTQEYF